MNYEGCVEKYVELQDKKIKKKNKILLTDGNAYVKLQL
jgi:hypothetical protein